MQILVINLEKDVLRRESVQKQLKRLNLPFQFIPGVLGSALSPEELAECYDDRKARWNKGISLVPAEVGCALSHIRAYRQIVGRNLDCALIMEDDVVLPAVVPLVLSQIEKVIRIGAPEMVVLAPPSKGSPVHASRRLPDSGHELLPFKSGWNAGAYIVTQLAARALVKALYPIGDVADCWSKLNRHKIVDLYVLTPNLINQDLETFGSSTLSGNLEVAKKMGWRKLAHKSRRAVTKLIDCFYAVYRRNFVPYAGIDLPANADPKTAKPI